jgi:hypothetical protein
MFIIIMNNKAGAVDIANLLSEHAAAFQKITGSAMTSWKPEGDSKGKTKARDAASILATMVRLQAKWDAPPKSTAQPNMEVQQQTRERERDDSKDPQGGDQTTMEVIRDTDTTPNDRSTTTAGIRGSLGVQAIFVAGLERALEGYLDLSQNFRLRSNKISGEWTIEFRLDEDMDQGGPPRILRTGGYTDLVRQDTTRPGLLVHRRDA